MHPNECLAALEQHRRWLTTVIRSRLRDSGLVEDVFQEVTVAILEARDRLQKTDQLGPWLYRVAIRQILQLRRKNGRQEKTINGYSKTIHEDSQDDPADWVLAEEQRSLIRQAMHSLSDRDREILLLKHTENWSYQQLADHLGVSRNAVEYRLLQARKRLRSKLIALNMHKVDDGGNNEAAS